jgi:imidazolonepropionase-like amidohydrolase
MENHAYFFIDSESDLAAKWPRILAGKPDFIKTFLGFSNRQKAPAEPWVRFNKGLDAKMLPSIVARAHAAGLRVSTHILTALDFATAVDAGVDEVNHLPLLIGVAFCHTHPASCLIDADTAKRAASRHLVVVSTMARVHSFEPDHEPSRVAAALEMEHANFTQLARAGVPIAIGSDGISGEEPFLTALVEAQYLHEHAFADNLTLLKMWSETTPQTIFPARKIGHLAPGYEASFLVLEGDPIADFANVKRIRKRVKHGEAVADEEVAQRAGG